MSEIIRTKRDGCWQVRSNTWGAFLMPADDPLAEATLDKGALERFELHQDIDPIPADLWSRWVALCFHFAHLKQGDLEVSCRLLRKEDDRSQWRILIPRQEVSGASVRIDSFDEAIDIESGELIASYPPEGWVPAGSSHSHNSMALAKFSSTDDASELGCPGLHIVLSHIDVAKRSYVCTASITANHRRFYLDDAAAVIDLTPVRQPFHPAVLAVVQPERVRGWLPLKPLAPISNSPWPDQSWPKPTTTKRTTTVREVLEPRHPISQRIEDLLAEAIATLPDHEIEQLLWDSADVIDELREQLLDFSLSWNTTDDDLDPTEQRAIGAAAPAARQLFDGEW